MFGFNSLFALRWSSTPFWALYPPSLTFQFALCAEVVFDNTGGGGSSDGVEFQFALCAEVVFDDWFLDDMGVVPYVSIRSLR